MEITYANIINKYIEAVERNKQLWQLKLVYNRSLIIWTSGTIPPKLHPRTRDLSKGVQNVLIMDPRHILIARIFITT
jgi:hypothetical protein